MAGSRISHYCVHKAMLSSPPAVENLVVETADTKRTPSRGLGPAFNEAYADASSVQTQSFPQRLERAFLGTPKQGHDFGPLCRGGQRNQRLLFRSKVVRHECLTARLNHFQITSQLDA